MYFDNVLTSRNDLIYANLNLVSSHFIPGDIAITLTWKPVVSQYNKLGFKKDTIVKSNDIRHYLRRVNHEFLGRDFKARGQKLKVINAFELNSSQGIHCHMILEKPVSSRVAEEKCIDTLMQCWLDMECSGYVGANLIEICDNPTRWIQYFLKDTASYKPEFVDYENWYLN